VEDLKIKFGAILPHTYLYGGVKRFFELGRIFSETGHSFTVYTPDGIPPAWIRSEIRVASFEELTHESNDILFFTERKLRDIAIGANARYKVYYHVIIKSKTIHLVRDKRFKIFACSTNILNHDRRWFGVTPFLAAGGIDSTRYYPKVITDSKEVQPFTILVYGRISEGRKGTMLVVKACERLYKKYPFIRLVLFDTPVNESMSKADKEFTTGVPFEFILNHPVEKNVALFHRADVFVAAEKRAGWANTVAEAMASGIPVVATKSGTMDMIIDQETGVFVRRNSRSIYRGIEKLIKSCELRQKLSVNGRRHIEKFDWRILTDKILKWYDEQEKRAIPGNTHA